MEPLRENPWWTAMVASISISRESAVGLRIIFRAPPAGGADERGPLENGWVGLQAAGFLNTNGKFLR